MKVVATGTWLYAGTVRKSVWIVRLDYDYWYGIAEAGGELEPGELPDLNPSGYLYYFAFREISTRQQFWPDSIGFKTSDEARKEASSKLPGVVAWD